MRQVENVRQFSRLFIGYAISQGFLFHEPSRVVDLLEKYVETFYPEVK